MRAYNLFEEIKKDYQVPYLGLGFNVGINRSMRAYNLFEEIRKDYQVPYLGSGFNVGINRSMRAYSSAFFLISSKR
jgi:hypothetical protein